MYYTICPIYVRGGHAAMSDLGPGRWMQHQCPVQVTVDVMCSDTRVTPLVFSTMTSIGCMTSVYVAPIGWSLNPLYQDTLGDLTLNYCCVCDTISHQYEIQASAWKYLDGATSTR